MARFAGLRPPPALGALMAVSLLLGVTWATMLPAFQAPDEQSHFNYVQSLGERFALPGGDKRKFFSTQVSEGIAAVNSDQVASQKQVKPEWSDRLDRRWERFSWLEAQLSPISPRSLSLALKQLLDLGLADRRLEESFPPRPLYGLTGRGQRLARAMG